MTLPVRIIDTGLRAARWNVAMTAALIERHADGEAPDTIRFHRYPACVLLGRGQNLAQVADAEYCRHHAIEIARRVTGGGAVYMSPRMLAWEVVVGRGVAGPDLDTMTRRISEGVAAGLSRLGAPARFRAPNTIECDGRKVSGSSGYSEGRSALLQGTVLIEDDVQVMARALRIPEAMLHGSVTHLAAVLGRVPPIQEIQDVLLRSLIAALDGIPAIGTPDTQDVERADILLRDEIGTDEFVTGVAAPDSCQTGP